MKHYAYEIINSLNNKRYIGKRSCKCDPYEDKYFGSSKYLRNDIKKYGKENFKKEILAIFDNEIEAFWFEKDTINSYFEKYDIYNRHPGGNGHIQKGKIRYKKESKNLSISLKYLLEMEDYCRRNNMTISSLIEYMWERVNLNTLEKFIKEEKKKSEEEEIKKLINYFK